MDKFTFGNTPAAIYLADHLNSLSDKRVVRKVQKILVFQRQLFTELNDAHMKGILSAKSLLIISQCIENQVIARLKEKEIEQEKCEVKLDSLTLNLVQNILIGEVKSISRRFQEATLKAIKEAAKKKQDPKLHTVSIMHVHDRINSVTLRAKAAIRRKERAACIKK